MRLSILRTDTRTIVRELDATVDVRGASSWSPDGKWIAAGGIGTDRRPGLFRFPVDGGPAEQVAAGVAKDPVWSPTEDLIVYCGKQVGPRLSLLAVRNGEPSKLSEEPIHVRVGLTCVRFLPDGSGLVYLGGRDYPPAFWHLDLTTGPKRRLTKLDAQGAIRTFDVSPDGSSIVFDRLKQNSDVVLIEPPAIGQ